MLLLEKGLMADTTIQFPIKTYNKRLKIDLYDENVLTFLNLRQQQARTIDYYLYRKRKQQVDN